VWAASVKKSYESYFLEFRINSTAKFQLAIHVRRFKVLNALDMARIHSFCV